MNEPDYNDLLKRIKSTSKAYYEFKLLKELGECIVNEHYDTAAKLRDLYILDFKKELPDMEVYNNWLAWMKNR